MSYRKGLSARILSDPVSWADRVKFTNWCKKNNLTTGQALARFIQAVDTPCPGEALPDMREEEPEYKPKNGDVVSWEQLQNAVCPNCGRPLDFEANRDENLGVYQEANCCGINYVAQGDDDHMTITSGEL